MSAGANVGWCLLLAFWIAMREWEKAVFFFQRWVIYGG
jgi:hypothetical protein